MGEISSVCHSFGFTLHTAAHAISARGNISHLKNSLQTIIWQFTSIQSLDPPEATWAMEPIPELQHWAAIPTLRSHDDEAEAHPPQFAS